MNELTLPRTRWNNSNLDIQHRERKTIGFERVGTGKENLASVRVGERSSLASPVKVRKRRKVHLDEDFLPPALSCCNLQQIARLSPRFLHLTSSPLLFSVSPFHHASIRPSVRLSIHHICGKKNRLGGGAVLIIRNRSLLFADNVSLEPRPRPPSSPGTHSATSPRPSSSGASPSQKFCMKCRFLLS